VPTPEVSIHSIWLGVAFGAVMGIYRVARMVKGRSWKELTARRGTGSPKYGWILAIFAFLTVPWWGAYPLASLLQAPARPSPADVDNVRLVLVLLVVLPLVAGAAWLKLSQSRRIQASVLRKQNRPPLVDDGHDFRIGMPD
jgi:hypothetical protein